MAGAESGGTDGAPLEPTVVAWMWGFTVGAVLTLAVEAVLWFIS